MFLLSTIKYSALVVLFIGTTNAVFSQSKKSSTNSTTQTTVVETKGNGTIVAVDWNTKTPELVLSLDLRNQNLTSVPVEITKFKNLTHLNLANNQLSDLPSALSSLTNLKELILDHNAFTSFPSELANLKTLTKISIADNHIQQINGSALNGFTQLEYLFLQNNDLTGFPTTITNLITLKSLYLYGNNLKSVPDDICKLTELKVLFLQANELKALPACVYTNLPKLVYFDVAKQKLIPKTLIEANNQRYFEEMEPGCVIINKTLNGVASYDADETFEYKTNVSVPKNEEYSSMLKKKNANDNASNFIFKTSTGLPHHKASKAYDAGFSITGVYFQADLELAKNNSGFGLYGSYSEIQYDNAKDELSYAAIWKSGVFYRQYLIGSHSNFRPYVKLGAGINYLEEGYKSITATPTKAYPYETTENDYEDQYSRINLQAKIGFDYYVNNWYGFHLETGLGSGSYVNFGSQFRFGKKR